MTNPQWPKLVLPITYLGPCNYSCTAFFFQLATHSVDTGPLSSFQTWFHAGITYAATNKVHFLRQAWFCNLVLALLNPSPFYWWEQNMSAVCCSNRLARQHTLLWRSWIINTSSLLPTLQVIYADPSVVPHHRTQSFCGACTITPMLIKRTCAIFVANTEQRLVTVNHLALGLKLR